MKIANGLFNDVTLSIVILKGAMADYKTKLKLLMSIVFSTIVTSVQSKSVLSGSLALFMMPTKYILIREDCCNTWHVIPYEHNPTQRVSGHTNVPATIYCLPV